MGSHNSPVLHSTKGLLIGDVVHEDEAHGPAVVGSGDGSVALLARCVLRTENKIYHCCEQLTTLYTVSFSHMQHMNKPIAQTWFKWRHLLGLNQISLSLEHYIHTCSQLHLLCPWCRNNHYTNCLTGDALMKCQKRAIQFWLMWLILFSPQ